MTRFLMLQGGNDMGRVSGLIEVRGIESQDTHQIKSTHDKQTTNFVGVQTEGNTDLIQEECTVDQYHTEKHYPKCFPIMLK